MYKRFVKRVLDILIALFFLPFFCFLFLILAPVIYFTDKGPVFYSAERLGYRGKIYRMHKFRSMYVNSPDLRNKDGSTYNGDDDPRVTRIGRIMRKTSLDELPQFINVLKGDMSVIGPRPHIVTNYKGYDSLTPEKKKRLEARPGITGYSQAYFRNSIDSDQKLKNDCYYIDHISFAFDVKIFFQTVKSVVMKKNIYVSETEPETVKQSVEK